MRKPILPSGALAFALCALVFVVFASSPACACGQIAYELNGSIQLPMIWGTPRELVPDALDVDGDGIAESLFYDAYADTEYYFLQFAPASITDPEDVNALYTLTDNMLHLFPHKQRAKVEDLATPNLRLLSLSLLTGEDAKLYAVTENVIFGASGYPTKFLEFFALRDGTYELAQIPADYKQFLLDACQGVSLDPRLVDMHSEYVDELGRWCLVMSQIDRELSNDVNYFRLRTCLTFDGGELKLVARYLDGRLVEGPY